MQKNHVERRKGFSLVELSIVLVVLGLLVGGVLGGQALIRASEVRSVGVDFDRYSVAVNAFRDKYNALPGDMRNATQFWGAAHATPATCYSTPSTGKETCNGSGNGEVTTVANVSNEIFRFWQHLASAELIEGQFSGIHEGTTSFSGKLGVNTPVARISGTGYHAGTIPNNYAGDPARFALDYGLMIQYGTGGVNTTPGWPALTTQETWSVDTKFDDGKPSYGNIIAGQWNDCTDAASELDTVNPQYDLAVSGLKCMLIYRKFIE